MLFKDEHLIRCGFKPPKPPPPALEPDEEWVEAKLMTPVPIPPTLAFSTISVANAGAIGSGKTIQDGIYYEFKTTTPDWDWGIITSPPPVNPGEVYFKMPQSSTQYVTNKNDAKKLIKK